MLARRARRARRPPPDHQPGACRWRTTSAFADRPARGPTAMEDFILREKITHFDHNPPAWCMAFRRHQLFRSLRRFQQPDPRRALRCQGQTNPGVGALLRPWPASAAEQVARRGGFPVKFYTDEGDWNVAQRRSRVLHPGCDEVADLVHASRNRSRRASTSHRAPDTVSDSGGRRSPPWWRCPVMSTARSRQAPAVRLSACTPSAWIKSRASRASSSSTGRIRRAPIH